MGDEPKPTSDRAKIKKEMTGEKLKRLRVSRGLSQAKLSRLSEIPQGTISKIESGSSHIAQLKIGCGKRLAYNLGITLDGLTSANGIIKKDQRLEVITNNFYDLADEGKLQLERFSNFLLNYS